MQIRNRILGIGLATLLGVAALGTPRLANAADHHRGSNDKSRTNAIVLGAVGAILVGNHQEKLGAVVLGAAAVEAAKAGRRNRDRDRDRDRYDRGRDRDRDRIVIIRDRDRDCDDDRYDRDRYDRDRYDRDRDDRYDRDRYDRDRYDRDRDCDRGSRGRDWAATRGKKRGWDKNGKR